MGTISDNLGMDNFELEKVETDLLIEAALKVYGYDFRNYAKASLIRRIKDFIETKGHKRISEIIPDIVYDREVFNLFIQNLSITVTDMFRDPEVYRIIRDEVIMLLKTYPFLKIWHAGCATGEEVYSLAILLKEEGLYDRCQIYATDFNNIALAKAKEGIYSLERVKNFTSNYIKAGGKQSFSNYYITNEESFIIDRKLKKNITFANHNLATDTAFGEMNLIMCRNVMIYFDQKLQNKVLKLFYDSLVINGVLCIGTKESLKFSGIEANFSVFSAKGKIYQKKQI